MTPTRTAAEAAATQWQPIATAPKDGTVIDVWVEGSRWPNVAWGKPDHCCGEAGQYCDSEWHGAAPGWFCTTFNLFLDDEEPPTHWMPLPKEPTP